MSSFPRNVIKSILLVDDDPDALDMYSDLLGQTFHGSITKSRHPTQALTIAKEHIFDIIIIDADFSDIWFQRAFLPISGQYLMKALAAQRVTAMCTAL